MFDIKESIIALGLTLGVVGVGVGVISTNLPEALEAAEEACAELIEEAIPAQQERDAAAIASATGTLAAAAASPWSQAPGADVYLRSVEDRIATLDAVKISENCNRGIGREMSGAERTVQQLADANRDLTDAEVVLLGKLEAFDG